MNNLVAVKDSKWMYGMSAAEPSGSALTERRPCDGCTTLDVAGES